MRDHTVIRILILAVLMLVSAPSVARQGEPPYSIGATAKHGIAVPLVSLPAIDAHALRTSNDERAKDTLTPHSKRLAIATGNEVAISPADDGVWQELADGSLLWRLRVQALGATDLHLGFDRYDLPAGAALWVVASDDYYEGPYTADDAGPLWVPMVPGDTATIELRLPAGTTLGRNALELSYIGAGFRNLFVHAKSGPGTSGACNINVICPLGQPYTDEQRALAYYEFRADDDGLTYICTGTLLTNVAADRKNYLMSAAHCLSSTREASSMRVYWNYQSSQCSTTTGYSFAQNQTGATLRATRADADFTLVELNRTPDAAWHVFYAGWDASNIAPPSSIGLHHPSGDVAKITQSRSAPYNYPNCIGTGGGSANTHWHAGPYNQGTTEGGSSGSGLWIPSGDTGGSGKRLIGVLSGGTAACSTANPTLPDNGFDCYGKFSAAWDGTNAAARLRDWLDPAGSGRLSIAGIDSAVTTPPSDGLATRIAADLRAATNRRNPSGRTPPMLPFDTRTRRTQ
jgi:hypothetical protein